MQQSTYMPRPHQRRPCSSGCKHSQGGESNPNRLAGPPACNQNRYRVTLTLWGSTANPVTELVDAPTVSLTKTMPAGKAYQATVEASNGALWSGATSPVGPLVVGRPGAVAKPGAVGGSGEIALTWKAAAADPYPTGTTYFAKARQLLAWPGACSTRCACTGAQTCSRAAASLSFLAWHAIRLACPPCPTRLQVYAADNGQLRVGPVALSQPLEAGSDAQPFTKTIVITQTGSFKVGKRLRQHSFLRRCTAAARQGVACAQGDAGLQGADQPTWLAPPGFCP